MSIPLKHFKKGTPKPELPDDGVLRFYSMRFCPYSERAALVLAAKKIPHHKVYIDLNEKPEWYTDYSPLGKVPAVQLTAVAGQPALVESLVIAEYLDEAYPERKLLPTDALQKALDKILIERLAPAVSAVYPVLFTNNPPADALQKFEAALDVFEEEIKKRGTPYFAGQQIGFVDYMLWPWFERFPALKITLADKYELDKTRYAKLLQWRDLVAQDEAVKAVALDPRVHAKFMFARHEGKPNYDVAFEPV
ncbi:pyrimidodiazepine synthase isoform X2 [Drosophila sulfurigaster albostrigata]|uniref:pyrimidodiazepine synthase isoform X2 n=1 Tax=Drosophila sulfurigaster albostrigata TaxID=89887 RepID=UPI002D2182A0|nr:pyrimidodiazepine synthase isoform X2 [Drosophila sulfurigaster albostrigata]